MTNLANEGTCDDSSNRVLAAFELLAGKSAHVVEFFQRDHLLMSRELKDAIRRSVEDRASAAHVLLAQLLNNFRARGRLIAQNFAPNGAFKWLDHLRRKT